MFEFAKNNYLNAKNKIFINSLNFITIACFKNTVT